LDWATAAALDEAAIDRPALRPLPAPPYAIAGFKRYRVNLDYHVEIDGHYYSVPHALVRQAVEARITQTTVGILHGGRRIASHPRGDRRGTHTTLAEHMPKAHRAHREWSPGRLLHWAERMGPHTKALVHHPLTHKPHPEMGYRACLGLRALARQCGDERLEAACARAVALGSHQRLRSWPSCTPDWTANPCHHRRHQPTGSARITSTSAAPIITTNLGAPPG
jgi:transposase